jgi:predicted GH43/DUF377 family glycosyl hydrolase
VPLHLHVTFVIEWKIFRMVTAILCDLEFWGQEMHVVEMRMLRWMIDNIGRSTMEIRIDKSGTCVL